MTKDGKIYYFLVDSDYKIQKLNGILGTGTSGNGSGTDETISDYVQQGLLLNLDAINNGENGSHDSNETEIWYDSGLIKNNAKLYNCSIGENYIEFNGSSSYATLPANALGTYQPSTIQILAKPENKSVLLADNASSRGLGINSNNQICTFVGNSSYNYYMHSTESDLFLNTRSYTIIYDGEDYNNTKVYLDSTIMTRDTEKNFFSHGYSYPIIGKRVYSGATSWPYKGKVYAIRVYNRILSEEEIMQNYKLDKVRFGLE